MNFRFTSPYISSLFPPCPGLAERRPVATLLADPDRAGGGALRGHHAPVLLQEGLQQEGRETEQNIHGEIKFCKKMGQKD